MSQDSGSDLASIGKQLKLHQRIAFKAAILIGLFGLSIGPISHHELMAKIMSVCAALTLTVLAGLYLFATRR